MRQAIWSIGMRGIAAVALLVGACGAAPTTMKVTDTRSPLQLDRVIDLPDVKGRIDHLALDSEHRHLFVAEYDNGSVDDIELATGRVVGRIDKLHEPQGVAYVPRTKELVIASGDGSVRFYNAADRHEVARLDLGSDADNIRIDQRNGHVIVGYGNGGLATIDGATHHVVARLPLSGHPEGFRLIDARVFINIPNKGAIVKADLDENRVTATWPTGLHRLNFPMIADPQGDWIAVAYRLPAALQIVATNSGKVIGTRSTCGDADDLFIEGNHMLVICGAGHIDVTAIPDTGTQARVETAPGARTGLFSPDLHRLFIAVPARRHNAAIWVLWGDTKKS
jgi:DNA-binding beta-propeller fold protein YncE